MTDHQPSGSAADGRVEISTTELVRRPLLPGRGDWLDDDPWVERSRPAGRRRREPVERPPHHRRELRPAVRLAGWVLLALAAMAAPFVVDPIQLSSLTRSLILAVTLLGLQVLLGYGGLLSLGQGAMLGVGAWVAGMLVTDAGLGGLAAIPVTAVALAAIGAVIGLPALRLSRIGLVLLTLAVAVSFPLLFQKFVGPLGKAYQPAPPPAWTGLAASQDHVWAFALAVAVTAVTYLGLRQLLDGRFGRSLQAVRDEPQAAAAFGVPVARVRLAAFALSAALAGAAGAVLLIQAPYVYGPDFPFQLSIQLFAVVLLIGADRLAAAVAGGLFLVLLPRFLSVVGLVGYEDLVYALVLLWVIVAFRGRGIGPVVDRWLVTGPLGRDRPPVSSTD